MHLTKLSLTLVLLLSTLTATLNIPPAASISRGQTLSIALPHIYEPLAAHISIPLATDLSLTITHLGDSIRPEEAAEYLHYGIERLRHFLHNDRGDDSLRHDRWSFGGLPDFEIMVRGTVSYSQLFRVVEGVQRFMLHRESSRDLQFDVHVEGKGRVGSGVVWHESSSATAKAWDVNAPSTSAVATNTSELLHLPDTIMNLSSTPNHSLHTETATQLYMPVTRSPWALVIDWLGAPMSPTLFYKSYVAARMEVREHSTRAPNEELPGGKWEYTEGGADISVALNEESSGGGGRGGKGKAMALTWERLLMVLECLHSFVTGDPPSYRVLHFEIREGKGSWRNGCVGCKGGVVVGGGYLVFHAPKPW